MAAHSSRGDGTDALEALQMKANAVTDESLESTRRMIRMCEESKAAGIKTLVALDDQGEQLEKIEAGLDLIHGEMQIAEKALKGMELCCGIFPKFWKKQAEFKEDDAVWNKGDDLGMSGNGPPPGSGQNFCQGGYVAKISHDGREEEMDDNLQQVNTMIGNLRNMAVDMSSELDSQNKQLDKINLKGSSNETRIKIANERAGKLLV